MIAPKQSATKLRSNLMQAKGSPEKHKHMDPVLLRLIQRSVQTALQELTKQKLVPKAWVSSLGGVRRKSSMPPCTSTTILPMSIASHCLPHLSLVMTSNLNVRQCTPICRRPAF
jgi:hypothetical protein